MYVCVLKNLITGIYRNERAENLVKQGCTQPIKSALSFSDLLVAQSSFWSQKRLSGNKNSGGMKTVGVANY